MSVTIKDISKDTGLSLATVSKYLNNKKISEENRLLIQHSIQRLNYIPNRTAQALRSKTSHCICIFMPDIRAYHLGYECNYIVSHMKEMGYSTIVRSYSSTPGDSINDIMFLENRQIDGVILFADADYPTSLLCQLTNHKIPYVCMRQKPDILSDFVGCSDEHAGRQAAELLSRYGHSKAALIGLDSYSSRHKVKGFLSYIEEHGCRRDMQTVCLHAPAEVLSDNYHDFLFHVSCPPSAVVFLDHTTTMQLLGDFINAVNQSSNPLSLMAFDDDDVFSAITPSLTVFAQSTKELGQQAATLLLKRMNGDFSSFPQTCLVSPILIERESIVHIRS